MEDLNKPDWEIAAEEANRQKDRIAGVPMAFIRNFMEGGGTLEGALKEAGPQADPQDRDITALLQTLTGPAGWTVGLGRKMTEAGIQGIGKRLATRGTEYLKNIPKVGIPSALSSQAYYGAEPYLEDKPLAGLAFGLGSFGALQGLGAKMLSKGKVGDMLKSAIPSTVGMGGGAAQPWLPNQKLEDFRVKAYETIRDKAWNPVVNAPLMPNIIPAAGAAGALTIAMPDEVNDFITGGVSLAGGLATLPLAAKYGPKAVKALQKKFPDAGIKDYDKMMPFQEDLTEFFGGNSLRKWFVPASERMPAEGSDMFQMAEASKGHANKYVDEELLPLIKDATPKQLAGVMQWYKSKRKHKFKDPEVRLFVAKVKEAEKKVVKGEGIYNPAAQDILEENFVKRVEQIFSDVNDIGVREVRRYLKKAGSSTFADGRVVLRELLQNPKIGEVTKKAALSLYDMNAEFPREMFEAFGKAANDLLVARVSASKGLTSAGPKPGWVRSKYVHDKTTTAAGAEVKTPLFVPEDVEDGFKELFYMQKKVNQFYQRYFMTPWKMVKVVLRAPAQFRNIMGNYIMNDIYGEHALPWYTPEGMKIYHEAWKKMRSGHQDLKNLNRHVGFDVSTFIGGDLGMYELPSKYNDNLMDKVLRVFYKSADATRLPQFYQWNERHAKFAKYLWNIKKGMGEKEAALDAVKSTFNYNDTTIFTRRMRESIMPFFTWRAKTFRMLPEAIAKHPWRVGKYAAIPMGLSMMASENLGVTEAEWKKLEKEMPQYLKKGWLMMLPFRDEKGRLQFMNLDWMIPGLGDLAEVTGHAGDPKQFLQSPGLKLLADFMAGKDTFTNQPWRYEWESGEKKLWRWISHVYKQVAPSVIGVGPVGRIPAVPLPMPFGADWSAGLAAGRGEEEAQTIGQFLTGQFGFKAIPADMNKWKRQRVARERQALAEMKAQMERGLRESVNPAEKSKARADYREKVKRYRHLMQEGEE